MPKIGWNFPPTNGGEEYGWRHSGIGHFRGSPVRSLARETIQNSLDARADKDQPVHIAFELRHIKQGGLEAVDQWRAALKACQWNADSSKTTQDEIQAALSAFDLDPLPFLRVADWNTTGLNGDKWHALVKSQAVSVKDDASGAGGSHGQGKFAPYAVSRLRTVFYWTAYESPIAGREMRFQGRAVFMTHQSQRRGVKGRTQGTGYFGIIEDCRELDEYGIPEPIRAAEESRASLNGASGTSLWIAGFQPREGWAHEIAATVLESYHPAISRGDLVVYIDHDGFIGNFPDIEITKDNLHLWFDLLLAQESGAVTDDVDQEMSDLAFAKRVWQMMADSEPRATQPDTHFGEFQVWAEFEPGLPSRIALVRGSGMVITTHQQGLQMRRIDDFAAVASFKDEQGNSLLRRMENPKHDQIEVSWLPEDERSERQTQLKSLFRRVRDSVRAAAPDQPKTDSRPISALARLLPDTNPGDESQLGDQDEGARVIVTSRKKRGVKPVPAPPGYATLDRVRVQPLGERRLQVSFTPRETVSASLEVKEVGDFEDRVRTDLELVWDRDQPTVSMEMELERDKRVSLVLDATDGEITTRAWTISARKLTAT